MIRPRSKKAPARAKKAPDEHQDQLALWTLRALIHTETWRYFLQDDGDDRTPLDLVGLAHLKSSRVSVASARKALRARLKELEGARMARQGVLFRNVDMLGESLALTAAEREILAFAIMLDIQKPLQACFERLEALSVRRLHVLLSEVLALGGDDVRKALARQSPLVATGLVRVASDVRRTWDDPLDVMEGLENILLTEYESAEGLLANFFRPSRASRLGLEDFPHAAADAELAVKLMAGALAGQTEGVNVLLHGAPGTGKTELARAIAQAVGATLYEVNVESEDGSALAGQGRFSAYQLCQKMLGRRRLSIVLFDEIEDVFPDRWFPVFGRQKRSGEDKGWTNRLLEGNPVPTLWLSNEVEQIDSAFLRRFDFIFELRTPPQGVRKRILERHMTGLSVRAPWVARVSGDERLTPATIESAVRVVRLAGLSEPEGVERALERVIENRMTVQGGSRPVWRAVMDVYDRRFLNASHDLDAMVDALLKKRALGRSVTGTLCLHGPPGTGKTAFAHHLADLLDKPLMVRRASDILGMYVGQTEANIARMFREALGEGAVLLLDEADSFLQERRGASHSWEVTQVNELLVQMEAFEGLFVCSTNLYEHLDQAVMRRFTLKIRFDPLRPGQRWDLFVASLEAMRVALPAGDGLDAMRRRLDALDGLTPGDFANVQRQSRMLDRAVTAEEFLAALEHERRSKPFASRAPLGFG